MQVKLDKRTVNIEKLPIGKYSELLKAIKQLPAQFSDLGDITNEKLLEKLPTIISESLPDMIGIIAIATPLKEEEIEELGLDEVTDIVLAIIEVNNYRKVFDNIKKAIAQPAPKK